MEHGAINDGHPIGAGPHLEVEGGILVCGTGGLQEADAVSIQERPAVQRRPDGRLAVEQIQVLLGARQAFGHALGPAESLVALLRDGPVEPEIRLGHLRIVGARRIEQTLERIGLEEVIGFQDAHVFTPCGIQALVHGSTVAGVGLVYHAHPGIGLQIALDDLAGRVGGTIVDADDLDIPQALTERGIQAFRQIALDVVDGHQQRYHRMLDPIHSGLLPDTGSNPYPSDYASSRTFEEIQPQHRAWKEKAGWLTPTGRGGIYPVLETEDQKPALEAS